MVEPHGSSLVDRYSGVILPQGGWNITLTHEAQIDVYNIAQGTYSPLTGFIREADMRSTLTDMRLENGYLWSIPIFLDIDEADARQIQNSNIQDAALMDQQNNHIATLKNLEIYPFEKEKFCASIFKTQDVKHPGVARVMRKKKYLIGGDLTVKHNWCPEFPGIRSSQMLTPREVREAFRERHLNNVVAFQTRNVPHRGHEYIQKCALEMVDGLLVHPVIGEKKHGDFRDHIILGAYEELLKKYYNPSRVIVSCLPWTMKYAGPKEAILHAIIRQNFGCSHFIIGRDHAGVGDYYGQYEAQEIFDSLQNDDLQIQIMRFENASYCPDVQGVVTDKTAPSPQAKRIFISGTKFRTMIQQGHDIPAEFIRPEIMDFLKGEKNIFVDE